MLPQAEHTQTHTKVEHDYEYIYFVARGIYHLEKNDRVDRIIFKLRAIELYIVHKQVFLSLQDVTVASSCFCFERRTLFENYYN